MSSIQTETEMIRHYVFAERFGLVALVWSESEVRAATLSRVILAPEKVAAMQASAALGTFAGSESDLPGEIRLYATFIHDIFGGRRFVFPIEKIPLGLCGPFQEKTLRQEHKIKPGNVSTYARLAAACGCPKAVRAVGSALSHNPFPLLIPCHRTVRSDGSLGGYQGGLAMKRWLLEMEGVRIGANGKIDLNSLSFGV